LIEILAAKWRKSHLSFTIAPVGDPTLIEKVVDCTNGDSLKKSNKT